MAIYDYHDENGRSLFQKHRYESETGKKTFRIFHPADGKWKPGIDSKRKEKTRRILYNLPDVVKANLVFFCEGEKDCQNVMDANLFAQRAFSIAATTTFDGAWQQGHSPKWLDSYGPYFTGKQVVIFEDNDEPGRIYAATAAAAISRFARGVRVVSFPELPERADVSDFLAAGHTAQELEQRVMDAPKWGSPTVPTVRGTAPSSAWITEGMDTFLNMNDSEVAWVVPNVLAPGRLTQIFAPRGIGKSLLANHWAVQSARKGLRVLILDRDNSRETLRTRLRSFGAEDLRNLQVVSRGKCPPLTHPEVWAEFPYAEFDLVIVDSLDAMAEGIGEQDSSKPAKAMAPLLDICHREGGPAVLLLGNTIKSAAHSRGSGVVEDRADIVFELRDGTDFKPTGNKPWIEELPARGAAEWRTRNARRQGRKTYRLALVATKFRDGEEPAPRMLEICTEDEPWTVSDVTDSIDAAGEAERLRLADEKAARLANGLAVLLAEIDSRIASGRPAILKTEAEELLMKARYSRADARRIISDERIVAIPMPGRGNPVELHNRMKVEVSAEMQEDSDPNRDNGFAQGDFCRAHLEHTAEIDPSQTRVNQSYSQPAISAADVSDTGKTVSGEWPCSDLEGKLSGGCEPEVRWL